MNPLKLRSCALFLAAGLFAGGALAATPTPPLLREVEAKYAKAATMMAEFTQLTQTATGQKKITSGLIMAKRPDKVRWETLKPDRNLLVSDGKTFWLYMPPFDEEERGQLIERKASTMQTRLANALLSGSFSMAKDMKIEEKDPSHYLLTPKRGSAGTISRAEITVNTAEKTIDRVVLVHRGGNRSEIQLAKIILGKELNDELFRFVPPANTDRVNE